MLTDMIILQTLSLVLIRHHFSMLLIETRVRGITCSVSARRWEGDWFDARPKLRYS